MPYVYNRIFDANLNRICEGLRVIEEYTRFITNNIELTNQLAGLRKKINLSETQKDLVNNLVIRDTQKDVRAKEIPTKRTDLLTLLKANFKRVEEGLRVLEEYSGLPLYNQCRYDVYQLEKEIILQLMQKNIKHGVYLISDDVAVLEKGLKWGVAMVQLRDKKATKKEILAKAYKLKEVAQNYQTPIIINDFLDIALLIDADGLHTGQDDLPLTQLRELFGPHKILGRTTHNLEQGIQAQTEGADYVSVGPLWATPSKPEREAIGFDYLQSANEKLTIPFVAIGGINLQNIDQVMQAQPPMIGVIRDYENIPQIINTYFSL
jgi:thiamine-phosphate pyrophosphorylase